MARTPAITSVLPMRSGAAPASLRGSRWRIGGAALAATLIAGTIASPALASHKVNAKLVNCGEDSCLQIVGHRDNAASLVSINGQHVSVQGERRWRVRLPIETVRAWSAPHARTIEVSVRQPGLQREKTASVDLPIGLLGHVTNLASLEISVR